MFLFRILFKIYNLYFSPDKALARRVQNMTGFVPARLSVFKLAFSHKSSQVGREPGQTNNERLEYLGDAVLGTVVADYLFKKYPNADEGFLTKMRSKIVKRKSLNYIGDQMGLNLVLSEYNRTRLSSSMLGNAVEALVGAVYLEKGYAPTKRFVVQRILKLYVDVHELETVDDNFKSQLLEACQREGKTVGYQLVNKYKQDRRDRFQVAVVINGEQIATADDYNKKAAEQLASLKALQKLNLIEPGTLPTGTHLDTAESESIRTPRKPKPTNSRQGEPASRRSERSERADRPDEEASASPARQRRDPAEGNREQRRHARNPTAEEESREMHPSDRESAPAVARQPTESSDMRPAKISFAEANARVAAKRAGAMGESGPARVTAETAAKDATGAVSSPADAPISPASKSKRDKLRSPTTYFNRHATRGAAAVATLLDGFDFRTGVFAEKPAAAVRFAPVEVDVVHQDRAGQLSPKPVPPAALLDNLLIQEAVTDDPTEALPTPKSRSRRGRPEPATDPPNETTTFDQIEPSTPVVGAETAASLANATGKEARRKSRERRQTPIAKHLLRKIVADAGAGVVAAAGDETLRGDIGEPSTASSASDLQPEATATPRKSRSKPRATRNSEAEVPTLPAAAPVALPDAAARAGIEFLVSSPSAPGDIPRARRKSRPDTSTPPAADEDLTHAIEVDLTGTASLSIPSLQAPGEVSALPASEFTQRDQSLDEPGVTSPRDRARDTNHDARQDAFSTSARASFTFAPDEETASQQQNREPRSRRKSAKSATSKVTENAVVESMTAEDRAITSADAGPENSWEDTLLELSFPEILSSGEQENEPLDS